MYEIVGVEAAESDADDAVARPSGAMAMVAAKRPRRVRLDTVGSSRLGGLPPCRRFHRLAGGGA
jgi:hypothetical protein